MTYTYSSVDLKKLPKYNCVRCGQLQKMEEIKGIKKNVSELKNMVTGHQQRI